MSWSYLFLELWCSTCESGYSRVHLNLRFQVQIKGPAKPVLTFEKAENLLY